MSNMFQMSLHKTQSLVSNHQASINHQSSSLDHPVSLPHVLNHPTLPHSTFQVNDPLTQSPATTTTETDLALLSAIEPLIQQQSQYIMSLEVQNSQMQERVRGLESQIQMVHRGYEKELDQVHSHYQEHIMKYRDTEYQIESERNKIKVEREDLERVKDLYRASNESLEAMNKRLIDQIQQQEGFLGQKDVNIKEVRDESLKLIRDLYKLQEECTNLATQLDLQTQDHLSLKDALNQALSQNSSLDSANQALKNDNRILSTKLSTQQNLHEEFAQTQRHEMESLQTELERYKKNYLQMQHDFTKQTSELDAIRTERLHLTRSLKEAQHDCELMTKLLEQQEKGNIEDRERLLSEGEARLKEQKEQVSIDQERLRLLIERNTYQEQELIQRQEDLDKQLEKRVIKVLDSERRLNKNLLEEREREINDLILLLHTQQTDAQRTQAEVMTLREEVRAAKAIQERLSQERCQIYEEKQREVDRVRQELDCEQSQLSKQVEELTEQVSTLQYELDSNKLTLSHLEHRSQDLASELHRTQDTYQLLKSKYEGLQRERDSMESRFNKDIQYWKDKAESLAEYSEEQLDKFGTRDQQRKHELKESAQKAWEALVQQERISLKWKHELEQTVDAYERQSKKFKTEIRTLRNHNAQLLAQIQIVQQFPSSEELINAAVI